MEDSRSIHAIAYFNLLKTGSWVEEKIKGALKPYSITHAQLNVLHILMENDPRPVSASQLKKGILVSNPDVTRLLDRLVTKGLVLRKTCPENRRKIDVCLTDNGRELFNLAHNSGKLAIGNFFQDQISENEAKQLRKILRKIRK